MAERPKTRDDFEIAILCALPLEADAILQLLDEIWEGHQYEEDRLGFNAYSFGRIGRLNLVIVHLPGLGKTSAAAASADLRMRFPRIQYAFLVGMCGVVPHTSTTGDIHLGDVIIANQLIQYDFSQQDDSGYITKDQFNILGRPGHKVLGLLQILETDSGMKRVQKRTEDLLNQLQTNPLRKPELIYPGTRYDRLFPSNYEHKHHNDIGCQCQKGSICHGAISSACEQISCDLSLAMPRKPLLEKDSSLVNPPAPRIIIGPVVSGDTIIRSAKARDAISSLHGAVAFEMEGVGIWDEIPCLLVKGACDYADGHKNKTWQRFAAAAAAASCKAIIENCITGGTTYLSAPTALEKFPFAPPALQEVLLNVANASYGPVSTPPLGGVSDLRHPHGEELLTDDDMLPVGELKDANTDSGYGTAPRTWTVTGSVNSPSLRQQATNLRTSGDKKTPEDDDILSVSSDDNDIHSQVSVETVNEAKTGKALIGLMLVGDAQFRSLSERILLAMGRDRFVCNLRRLLKSFYQNLTREMKDEGELATTKLLRSRRGRVRMSNKIADFLEREDEEEHERAFQISEGARYRLELLLSGLSHKVGEHDSQKDDSDNSTSASEDDEPPHVAAIKKVILESKAFKHLLADLLQIFLPTELRQVLQSIPEENIQFSANDRESYEDSVKIWVQKKTQIKWNWWPLEEPKSTLHHNESRMWWKCTCGARQWREISDEQCATAIQLLQLLQDKPRSQYWCVKKLKRPSIVARAREYFQTFAASRAAQRYVPPADSSQPSGSILTGSSNPETGDIANSRPAMEGGAISTQASYTQASRRTSSNPTNKYILFGVQGPGRTMTPGEVYVSDQSNDFSVFQDLKKCYESRRGFWRLYFSIWRLEYCDVTKFNRLALNRMVHDYRELPDHNSYDYYPRVGSPSAKNPPLSTHMFQAIYYACKPMCDRLSFFHDCILAPSGRTGINRIPKRSDSFEHDQTREIWGLEAVFEVSFAYVFLYHCLLVIGPFVFWGWWVGKYPGDWQNASVPLTAVLGGLSLFWSSSGILTAKVRI